MTTQAECRAYILRKGLQYGVPISRVDFPEGGNITDSAASYPKKIVSVQQCALELESPLWETVAMRHLEQSADPWIGIVAMVLAITAACCGFATSLKPVPHPLLGLASMAVCAAAFAFIGSVHIRLEYRADAFAARDPGTETVLISLNVVLRRKNGRYGLLARLRLARLAKARRSPPQK